jgi:hypothetical protein
MIFNYILSEWKGEFSIWKGKLRLIKEENERGE